MRPIDADALIEKWKYDAEHMASTAFKFATYAAINDIKYAPTVEPGRKKGMWFLTDTMYACNQCHSVFYETSPFCPMCGADMRGEQDG